MTRPVITASEREWFRAILRCHCVVGSAHRLVASGLRGAIPEPPDWATVKRIAQLLDDAGFEPKRDMHRRWHYGVGVKR